MYGATYNPEYYREQIIGSFQHQGRKYDLWTGWQSSFTKFRRDNLFIAQLEAYEVAKTLRQDLRVAYQEPVPLLTSPFEVKAQPCPGVFKADPYNEDPIGTRERNLRADAHVKSEYLRKVATRIKGCAFMHLGLLYLKADGEQCLLPENPWFNRDPSQVAAAEQCQRIRVSRERTLGLPLTKRYHHHPLESYQWPEEHQQYIKHGGYEYHILDGLPRYYDMPTTVNKNKQQLDAQRISEDLRDLDKLRKAGPPYPSLELPTWDPAEVDKVVKAEESSKDTRSESPEVVARDPLEMVGKHSEVHPQVLQEWREKGNEHDKCGWDCIGRIQGWLRKDAEMDDGNAFNLFVTHNRPMSDTMYASYVKEWALYVERMCKRWVRVQELPASEEEIKERSEDQRQLAPVPPTEENRSRRTGAISTTRRVKDRTEPEPGLHDGNRQQRPGRIGTQHDSG